MMNNRQICINNRHQWTLVPKTMHRLIFLLKKVSHNLIFEPTPQNGQRPSNNLSAFARFPTADFQQK